MSCRLIHATAAHPGAIAILQLLGDASGILQSLTGVNDWPLGRMRLVHFADIDQGLAVRLTNDVAELMPHGGPRVMQRLTAKLVQLGALIVDDVAQVDPLALYPEAID